MLLKELQEYINLNLEKKHFKVSKKICSEAILCDCCSNIDEYLEQIENENKFQKLLFKHIDSRNLKDSDVYNKVNIDRRLFSKIRSDINYHPSKETIILLAISLELNEDELVDLLNSASYSLPKNNIFDLIIRFCFERKIYDISKINEFLYTYKCKALN